MNPASSCPSVLLPSILLPVTLLSVVGQVANLRRIVNPPTPGILYPTRTTERTRRVVGQAILPAAGFQPALSGNAQILAPGKSRLKAGYSQDWLPSKALHVR